MRRVALLAGLTALAGAGLNVAAVLPATHTARPDRSPVPITLPSSPLTITIAPAPLSKGPEPTALAVAPTAFATILSTGQAATLDARLRAPIAAWLKTQPSLASALAPIRASPSAEGVVLLAAAGVQTYPTLNAIAPLVVRLAYQATRAGARAGGVLLTIERLARAAAQMSLARP